MRETFSRRRFLRVGGAVAALAVAGCGSDPSETDGPTATETTPARSPPTDGAPGSATLSDQATAEPTTTVPCERWPDFPPMPTPTSEGLRPMQYPEFPSPVTAESAESFAESFEEAFQHNRFLDGDFIPGTDSVLVSAGVPNGFVVERRGGFLVGVNSTIATEDASGPTEVPGTGTATPTAAPAHDNEFATWYHVTDRVARRTELAESALPADVPDSVDLSMARTVLCA